MIERSKFKIFFEYMLTKEILAASIVSIFGLFPITISLYNSDITHNKNIDIQTHARKAELYASTISKLDEIGSLYPNILLEFSNMIDAKLNMTKSESTKFLRNQFTKAQENDIELFYYFYSLEPYITDKTNSSYITMLIKNITGRSSESILILLNSYIKKIKNKSETDYVRDEMLESLMLSTNKDFSEFSSEIFNYRNEIKVCLKDFLFNQGKCPYSYATNYNDTNSN